MCEIQISTCVCVMTAGLHMHSVEQCQVCAGREGWDLILKTLVLYRESWCSKRILHDPIRSLDKRPVFSSDSLRENWDQYLQLS